MQFSLRSLFLATAGVAALFALACTLPDAMSLAVMTYVTLILPGAVIALVVYGRGYVQAFAIGCSVSPVGPAIFAIPFVVVTGWLDQDNTFVTDYALGVKFGILMFHFMNISCGLLAVGIRWWIERAKVTNDGRATMLEDLTAKPLVPPTDEPYAVIQGRVRMVNSSLAARASAPTNQE